MKNFLMVAGLLVSTHAMASTDYSYCQQALNMPDYMGVGEGYPFKLTDDGKIKPHASVKSYKADPKERTETIVYGEKNMQQKVVVVRNEAGELEKIVTSFEYDAPEVKTGVGAKKKGMGMYPGIGIGMGMYGMGYPGMMGAPQDMKTDMVTDFKVQNGKCVPHRSLMETKTGKVFSRHFVSDLQLCRDMKNFFKKNPEAEACFGNKYNDAVNEVMKGHQTRNADVYEPEESKDSKSESPFGGYGVFPGGVYDGGGFNSPGMSYNSLNGGYGMFLDNLATTENYPGQQSPLTRGQMIMQYCNANYGPMSKMIADEALFAVESATAKNDVKGTSK